jgi:hypothetical protein
MDKQDRSSRRRLAVTSKAATTDLTDPAEVAQQTSGEHIELGRLSSGMAVSPNVTLHGSIDEEKDTVIVPKSFKLTLDDGAVVHYDEGIGEMPKSHAAHWFSKAQGVKVYVPKSSGA